MSIASSISFHQFFFFLSYNPNPTIMNLFYSLLEISCTSIINPTTVKYLVIKLDLSIDLESFIYWLLTCIKIKNTRRKFYFFNVKLKVY